MAIPRKPRKGRCYNRQEFGHIKRDCTNSKQERSTTSKWCSLHNSMTHNDAERKGQKGKESANTPPQDEITNTLPQGEVHSAHTMTEPMPTEEEDCGYAFVTPSPASQGEADALPRSQPVSHIHMDDIIALPTVRANYICRRLGAVQPTI